MCMIVLCDCTCKYTVPTEYTVPTVCWIPLELELLCGCCELNLHSLQEKQVLLTELFSFLFLLFIS